LWLIAVPHDSYTVTETAEFMAQLGGLLNEPLDPRVVRRSSLKLLIRQWLADLFDGLLDVFLGFGQFDEFGFPSPPLESTDAAEELRNWPAEDGSENEGCERPGETAGHGVDELEGVHEVDHAARAEQTWPDVEAGKGGRRLVRPMRPSLPMATSGPARQRAIDEWRPTSDAQLRGDTEMRVSTHQRKRAWIPDYDSGDEAIGLALSWIRKEAGEQDPAPLLVTNTFNNGRGLRSVQAFADRNRWITPRSEGDFDGFRPVVAFVPAVDAFALAEQRSHKSLLCVSSRTCCLSANGPPSSMLKI
jgi:hypothetical protein